MLAGFFAFSYSTQFTGNNLHFWRTVLRSNGLVTFFLLFICESKLELAVRDVGWQNKLGLRLSGFFRFLADLFFEQQIPQFVYLHSQLIARELMLVSGLVAFDA